MQVIIDVVLACGMDEAEMCSPNFGKAVGMPPAPLGDKLNISLTLALSIWVMMLAFIESVILLDAVLPQEVST